MTLSNLALVTIKLILGGFCGGSVPGESPSGNKCVGTAQQAIDGDKNGMTVDNV